MYETKQRQSWYKMKCIAGIIIMKVLCTHRNFIIHHVFVLSQTLIFFITVMQISHYSTDTLIPQLASPFQYHSQNHHHTSFIIVFIYFEQLNHIFLSVTVLLKNLSLISVIFPLSHKSYVLYWIPPIQQYKFWSMPHRTILCNKSYTSI